MDSANNVNVQLSSVLIVLLAGMILGAVVDLYRVLRGRIIGNKNRRRGLVDFFGDLCFWGLALILITPILFWGTWLELRLYVWLLMPAGVILYFGIFSPALIPLYLNFWLMVFWLPKKLVTGIWCFGNQIKKLTGRFTSRISKN
jgi:spore cortex biosynthesis protein YabQ